MPDAENHVLPGRTNDSWRAWLMTGVRRAPADRRRLRGAHRGLKRLLLEGMANDVDRPHAWKDFSGAMIRHAVDDAMRSLPHQDTEVVKLAYFGGYSNRAIADQVGLTEATVQRRLRRALSAISEHIQRGRAVGRKAAYAVMLWLSGRWLSEAPHHFSQAALVVSVAVVVAAQPAAPGNVGGSSPPVRTQAAQVHSPARESVPAPAPAALPPVQTPSVKLPVEPPALPPLPVKVKVPQL